MDHKKGLTAFRSCANEIEMFWPSIWGPDQVSVDVSESSFCELVISFHYRSNCTLTFFCGYYLQVHEVICLTSSYQIIPQHNACVYRCSVDLMFFPWFSILFENVIAISVVACFCYKSRPPVEAVLLPSPPLIAALYAMLSPTRWTILFRGSQPLISNNIIF